MPARGQQRVRSNSRKTGGNEKPVAPETLAFANRLTMTREQRGYDSAAKFAKAIGVEDETYRTWERGIREPAIPNICKIARKLDISLDYLILGDLPSYKTPTKPSH